MIVVADTTPINHLILLGHIELLPTLFRRVLIPNAVLWELLHAHAPLAVKMWAAAPPHWLEIVSLEAFDADLSAELDLGEREAISLALERRADVLLIDEMAGRHEAVRRHLSIAGTLAILSNAGLRGHLDFPAELDRLRETGFYVSASLGAEMLARYNSARQAGSEQR